MDRSVMKSCESSKRWVPVGMIMTYRSPSLAPSRLSHAVAIAEVRSFPSPPHVRLEAVLAQRTAHDSKTVHIRCVLSSDSWFSSGWVKV
jgi:hypothetical protein